MNTFYGNTSQFPIDENDETLATANDNLSLRMNHSRMLLSEFGTDTTNRSLSASQFHRPPQQQTQLSQSLLKRTVLQASNEPLPIQQQQQQHHHQQSSIYAQFKLDTNKQIDEEANLVELVAAYSSICAEHIQFLQEKINTLKLNRQKQDQLNTVATELDELEREKNLWNLMHVLYLDEEQTVQQEAHIDNETMDTNDSVEIGFDEALLVRQLLKKNHLLRKIKLVIEWCEKISAESKSLEHVRQKIGEFQEKCSSWEHTLHHLKNAQSFNKKENYIFSNREFVDELDPDAPIRQNKPLHDLDQEDEYKVMEYVYAFIRAGELGSARDFLFKIGQSWRAATFEGCRLFSDRNYSEAGEDGKVFLNEGNFNRDVWRLMVQRLIKDEHFSPYEKAAYGSLGGFVGPILPVCRTYMDFIWAYFKVLYNNIIEIEIRQKMSGLREFTNVPFDNDEDYFFNSINKVSSAQSSLPNVSQIFERIKVLVNNSDKNTAMSKVTTQASGLMPAQLVKNLKADAQSPFSIILKHVIMSGIDGFRTGTNDLMEYLRTMITSNQQNGLLLRFSSHLALFYRAASFQLKEDTFVEIIDNYSEYLIRNQYREIIAYYVSQLPAELQITRYSKFLQTITDNKVRQLLLKLAKERNMNVQAITQNIVDLLSRNSSTRPDQLSTTTICDETTTDLSTTAFLGRTADMFTPKTGQILTEEDKTRINAIDWIIYDSVQRFKLLEYANLTMRHFLLDRQNFEATKSIYTKIPKDTLNVILTQYNFNATSANASIETNFQQMIDNLPSSVTNTIKEYLCFKEYIEAVNVYNDWFDFFHKEKPVKPAPKFDLEQAQLNQQQSGLDKSNIFAERIAYDYQLKQYEDLMNRWSSKARIYCDKARSKFLALLKFPFGGWMVDVVRKDEEEEDNEEDEGEMTDMNGDSMMQTCVDPAKNEARIRRVQMKALGKLYLPNVCFVLTDMLTKMNMNKDLIRLSDLIASENYKLYRLFEKKQWRCLISKIADASICLLDEGGDYLGYN